MATEEKTALDKVIDHGTERLAHLATHDLHAIKLHQKGAHDLYHVLRDEYEVDPLDQTVWAVFAAAADCLREAGFPGAEHAADGLVAVLGTLSRNGHDICPDNNAGYRPGTYL